MKRQVAVLSMALAVAGVGCTKGTDNAEVFQVTLAGANEVPARATGASGAMGFVVRGNRVDYSIEVYALSTPIIGAHIHCCGAQATAGVNGPIRIALFPGPGANATANPLGGVNGQLYEGSFEASDVTGVTYEELLASMRAGTAYGNVHTTQFPGGEIRGQVRLVTTN
jgi:CHRD domain-containing protein